MKILIVSAEVWRDDTNGGNVLSNLFQGMNEQFAQIFCNPGSPLNSVCKQYFQITDSMIINNLLHKKAIGRKIIYQDFPNKHVSENKAIQENKAFYNFFRRYHLDIFEIIREILWKLSDWKTKALTDFILEFNPDVIFAPCYASHYMLRLTRYVATLTEKKVISYISDDNYSLKQWRFSPIFWINRMILRSNMRKTFPYYSLLYTMTIEQKNELEKIFTVPIKILCKGGHFENYEEKQIKCPIQMVYAGGIYCRRWKTLSYLGEILKEINKNEVKVILSIFTQTNCTQSQRKALHDGRNIFLQKSVTQNELKKIYYQSDIALHVESFEKKYKYGTRLSFSTKIIDCLASSCAVMAIAWKYHAGLHYLQSEDAAICVSDLSQLRDVIIELVNNPNIIEIYRKKAFDCGVRNHQINEIRNDLYQDFIHLL